MAAVVAIGVGAATGVVPVTPLLVSTIVGYLLLATTVVFFAWLFLDRSWTAGERRRLYLIGVLFLGAALFWSVFEQAGSTLNLFAERSTRNSLAGVSFPSSWFQSLNPIFIMTFAPVAAWLWVRLGARNPSSPAKFSFALIGAGLGFLILVPAAALAAGGDRVSPSWLIATYLVHTLAELCLSPVGLSSMTRLAPARIASLVMGVWFLGSSVGNYLGGRMGGLYESLPLEALFQRVGLFAVAAGILMLAFSKRLARLMH
jgi:POT family proton-dependent oligopeptide transporter